MSTGGLCNFTAALLNSCPRLNSRVSREKRERRCSAGGRGGDGGEGGGGRGKKRCGGSK